MGQIAEIAFHVQGDIGGTGISRFRFIRQDSAAITGSDVNAVAAAVKTLLAATSTYMPSNVSWACVSQVNIYDVASGTVQPPLVISSIPSTVNGSASGQYAAGVGGRLNWKTSALSGRRLLRGATYLVPWNATAFTGTGGIQATVQTAVNTAATTYLNALTTAALYPVIWHRPLKGTTSGGLTGIVFSGVLGAIPATLRSRRE